MNDLLSGFYKAHSTQHGLFRLMKSWKKELDNSVYVGALLMDLWYDCFSHELLIAKLEAYCLDKFSLGLVKDYLSFQKKGQKLALHIVTGLMLPGVFLKDLFQGLYFLISLSMVFSCSLKILIYVILLTISHCSHVEIISQ